MSRVRRITIEAMRAARQLVPDVSIFIPGYDAGTMGMVYPHPDGPHRKRMPLVIILNDDGWTLELEGDTLVSGGELPDLEEQLYTWAVDQGWTDRLQ